MPRAKKTYIINQESKMDNDPCSIYDVCFGIECAIEHMKFLASYEFGVSNSEVEELFNAETNSIEFYDMDGFDISLSLIEVRDTRSKYQKCHDLECSIDTEGSEIVVYPFYNTRGLTDCFF